MNNNGEGILYKVGDNYNLIAILKTTRTSLKNETRTDYKFDYSTYQWPD